MRPEKNFLCKNFKLSNAQLSRNWPSVVRVQQNLLKTYKYVSLVVGFLSLGRNIMGINRAIFLCKNKLYFISNSLRNFSLNFPTWKIQLVINSYLFTLHKYVLIIKTPKMISTTWMKWMKIPLGKSRHSQSLTLILFGMHWNARNIP